MGYDCLAVSGTIFAACSAHWVAHLSVQNNSPPLVDPEILLDQASVLEGYQAIGETYEAVSRGHRCVGGLC